MPKQVLPYPQNLINEIFVVDEGKEVKLSTSPQDALKGLEYIISTLEEQERNVILRRFVDGENIREISEKLELSREKIRQIQERGLRKLGRRCEYIIFGYDGVAKMETEREAERQLREQRAEEERRKNFTHDKLGEVTLKEAKEYFDVRVYNALSRCKTLRKNITWNENVTLGKLDNMSDAELSTIQNFGANSLKSFRETMEKLKATYGITGKLVNVIPLTFVDRDSYNCPVYKDPNNRLVVDTNYKKETPCLYTLEGNCIEGMLDKPIEEIADYANSEIRFEGGRVCDLSKDKANREI